MFVGLWLAMFAWANIPPYRGNVLEHERGFFVWHWRLYTTAGHDICDVRYYDHNSDDAPIERWKLLGYERPGLMPDALARTEKDDLFKHYDGVCRALRRQGDPEPDVRVEARCADKTYWKRVERRTRNVCPVADAVVHRRPKSKSKPKPKSKPKSKPPTTAKQGAR